MPSLFSSPQSHLHKLATGPTDSQRISSFLCLEVLHFCQIFTSEVTLNELMPNCHGSPERLSQVMDSCYLKTTHLLKGSILNPDFKKVYQLQLLSAETKSKTSHFNYSLHIKIECVPVLDTEAT